ncbi:hypothetical protein ACFSKW_05380 [Nonomuraea mangrovi]|uniref:Uncharacterized protein n=1 Tax=Nonomuraea mangrovi TaxID=2316207 RepID=A0ABW4SP69_9ACTN
MTATPDATPSAQPERPGMKDGVCSEFTVFTKIKPGHAPRQDISDEETLRKMDALSFTPWRVTAEHAPLGEIMRAREEVYRRSSIQRHRLNQQERREPRSADEVSS